MSKELLMEPKQFSSLWKLKKLNQNQHKFVFCSNVDHLDLFILILLPSHFRWWPIHYVQIRVYCSILEILIKFRIFCVVRFCHQKQCIIYIPSSWIPFLEFSIYLLSIRQFFDAYPSLILTNEIVILNIFQNVISLTCKNTKNTKFIRNSWK